MFSTLWYDPSQMAGVDSNPRAIATPILDSAVLPIPKRKKKIVGVVWGLLLGFLLATVLIREGQISARNPASNFVVLFYFAAILCVIVVHECGHLLAGWAVGFKFSRVGIGPFCLKIEHGRLKVEARGRLTGAAGYAGMHINKVRRLRRRLLIFTAGGPVANFLAAATTSVFLGYSPLGSLNNWISLLATLFAQISLIVGLVNLIPFSVGALFSDGARMAILYRSRPRARRWFSITALADQTRQGIRPKQLRRTWLSAASCVHDGSIDDFAANWLAYASASDRKDDGAAALHLERCLELTHLLGPSLQGIASLEATVFMAWFRRDPELAQKWFDRVKNLKSITPLQRIRVDVALLCGKEEFDLALGRSEEGAMFIAKLPASPTQNQLREGWMEWQEEIRQRRREKLAHEPSVVTQQISVVGT